MQLLKEREHSGKSVCEAQRCWWHKRARVHIYCADELDEKNPSRQPAPLAPKHVFTKLGQISRLNIFECKKRKSSMHTSLWGVFLLRVVLASVGEGGWGGCRLTEGGNGLCLSLSPLDQLSSACPLRTTTSIPQIPVRVWDGRSRRNLAYTSHPLSLDRM